MKKVLMVTRPISPPWDEASKNFAYNLASGLTKFEPTLLTPGHVESLSKNIKQLPLYTGTQLSLKQKARLIKVYAHRKNYDVIHFMLTPNKVNAYSSRFIVGKGKAKTIQTIATLRDDIYDTKTLRKILFADMLVTYSDHAKRKLQQMGYSNVARVYPGIDFNYYKPADKDEGMLKVYGINKKDFVVTYPGEYVRLGVTDTLVDIIPDLIKTMPNIKFVFACRIKNERDAQKKAVIQNHFKNLGLEKNIAYTDTVSDMAKLYNLSDVVLFPVKDMSGKFDVPLSVIEAMACGKPVVVSDLPVLSEFTSADNSIVIPHNDLSGLTKKLQTLYEDPQTKRTLGKNARDYVLKHFDIKESRKMYEKIYEDLTS